MNESCIRCGKAAILPIHALEVRTLHIRGAGGERRVQALGDEKSAAVCESCAKEHLELLMNPRRAARPQAIRFGIVLAAGVLVEAAAFLFLNRHTVFVALGIFAVLCGIIGIVDAFRSANEKYRFIRGLPEAEALPEAAWMVFLSKAPRKDKENDLTYIPINSRSLARKNGDLMILYHLLPEIAVEAWKRMHPEKDT